MKNRIRAFAKDIGIEKCGFAKTDDGKSAVVCLFPYFNGFHDGNLSVYAYSCDYHKIAAEKLELLKSFILSIKKDAVCSCRCDIGEPADRLLAYRGGLGFFGKNGMLINDDFGSYFFIGYVLCDIALASDAPLDKTCAGCGQCIEKCPGNALENGFDITKCASEISQKKGDLSEEEQKILKKSSLVFGCDMCQKVCPHNSIIPRPMEEFLKEPIYNLKLSDIENLSNKEFLKKYKDRAFSWRGKAVLVRNLRILEHDNN